MTNLTKNVYASEAITRYIFDKSQYAPTKGRVKYNAFLPNKNGETSVYRITALNNDQIWDLGLRKVAQLRGIPLRARADFTASDVLTEDLIIEPDTSVHARHANIVGWPEQNSEQRLIAMKLADKARLDLMFDEI